MNRYSTLLSLLCGSVLLAGGSTGARGATPKFVVDTRTAASQTQALPSWEPTGVVLLADEQEDGWGHPIVERIYHLLALSGQCTLTHMHVSFRPTRRIFKGLEDHAPLGVWIECGKKPYSTLSWVLYETKTGAQVAGKQYTGPALARSDIAQVMTRDIWREIMGEDGPFLSKLAYVKRIKRNGMIYSKLCIAQCDGSAERCCVSEEGILVAPVWHHDIEHPCIMYSQFTLSNVRLMATDMCGTIRPLLDVDGTVAGITITPDGLHAAYCRSGTIWDYAYDPQTRRGVHRILVREDDPVASPCWYGKDELVYCCKGQIKAYNRRTGTRRVLVKQHYAVAPHVHSATNRIAYAGKVGKHLQIWVYDKGKVEQLTHDAYDHTDPSWSPCGTYLVYGIQPTPRTRCLEVIHVATRKKYRIEGGGAEYLYPAWSPSYDLR